MNIILIPGLWLDASSWSDVTAQLERAGHKVHALTMPGVGLPAAQSAQIGIADWINAAVATLDTIAEPSVVVGHSGGGNVAWGVADTRPDLVSRVIFVDTVPPPPGFDISEFPIVDGVVPFPGWDAFDADDVDDLDPATRERTAPLARSVPARVPTDAIPLSSAARYRVPVTLLMGARDREALEAELVQWEPFANEYRAIRDVEVVRIGSGHWPQFSVPHRLAGLIESAVAARQ